jgi:hypothetical protein
MMEKQWYVATLILQCRIENTAQKLKTADEQVRVLRAPDIEAAYGKALQLGKNEEHSYENMYGQIVYWEFLGLADLEELPLDETIEDGTEIKSRLLRKKDPMSLVQAKEHLTVFRWERDQRAREASRTSPAD